MENHAWTRAALSLGALVAFVSPARADLTVSFATDGPAPAMSATVVASGELGQAEPETAASPEEAERAEPPGVSPIAVRFVRIGDGSGESATLTIRDASGEPGADALDRLSILARPRGVDAPARLDAGDADFVAPGIRRLHAGLLPLLSRLSEHFPDRAIQIVSGYRPDARPTSRHRFGRALDLRVDGVGIDEVRAFLDGEPGTGVGLYPVSDFVHLDVRTDSVRWVDDSGPGEPQHVVRSEVVARDADADVPSPRPDPEPRPEPATTDDEAIERAMRAADAITLDLGLPR